MVPEAFFLPVAAGQLFCLYYPAATEQAKGALLYLPPFAEEMNKARRMAALQARLLAQHGYAVLQVDLRGCGDSSGDFGDANWSDWLDDIDAATTWLRSHCPAPLWLWGLRTGCLLASAARLDGAPVNFLLWQPVVSGKQFLQQFLRLKAAGEMMSGDSKGVMEMLKTRLATGHAVEIAGYRIAPALAKGLAAAELSPPDGPGQVIWLELSARPAPTLAPVSQQRIEQWQAAGRAVSSAVLPGPTFWQTAEIEEAPALLAATLTALEAAAS